MLFVKTEVRPSRIHGLGLFAAESIQTGTLIAQFDLRFGWSCTENDRIALPQTAQDFIGKYAWRTVEGLWLLDIDDTRYMNHSETPNMLITTESRYTAKAARDIATGEELTENYRQFDPDFATYSSRWT